MFHQFEFPEKILDYRIVTQGAYALLVGPYLCAQRVWVLLVVVNKERPCDHFSDFRPSHADLVDSSREA